MIKYGNNNLSATSLSHIPQPHPSATCLSHITQPHPSATSISHIPQPHPSATSLSHIPQPHPSATSLSHIPQPHPSATSLSHIPQPHPSATSLSHIPRNINNNNINIVAYSLHPYLCVNNIVLTLFMKQSKFDVLICSLNLFHSHGAAYMNERSIGSIIS